MWYIGTLQECQDYNTKVNLAKAYTGSITSNWANPRMHPDGVQCAIIASPSVEPDEASALTSIETLPADWMPSEGA
jgi:hypothetical protein